MNLLNVMNWNCSCNIKQLGGKAEKNNDSSKGRFKENLLFVVCLNKTKRKRGGQHRFRRIYQYWIGIL